MKEKAKKEWSRASVQALAIVAVVCGILPFFAAAQDAAMDLRTSIRNDLMADPRSASFSQTEIETIVEALASESENQGVNADYISGRSAVDYSEAFAAQEMVEAPAEGVPTAGVLWGVLVLIVGAILLIIWRAHGPRTLHEDPPATA